MFSWVVGYWREEVGIDVDDLRLKATNSSVSASVRPWTLALTTSSQSTCESLSARTGAT